MRTLTLVRHAEARPGSLMVADRDRPLNERGVREAEGMGLRLAQRGVKPDLLLASPARRALGTARLLATALGVPPAQVTVKDSLYAASAHELLSEIAQLDDASHRVMLVAHNPGLADLAHHFASAVTHMPTCAVVELTFDASSWADLDAAVPTQVVVDAPNPA